MDSSQVTRLASNQKIAGSSPARLDHSFLGHARAVLEPVEMTPNSDVVGEGGLRSCGGLDDKPSSRSAPPPLHSCWGLSSPEGLNHRWCLFGVHRERSSYPHLMLDTDSAGSAQHLAGQTHNAQAGECRQDPRLVTAHLAHPSSTYTTCRQ